MTQTLVSSTIPLCPVLDFLKRVDNTAVGLLASDVQGQPVEPQNLATDPNVLAALMDATGDFESAALMGQRYSSDDLALLLATTCGSQGTMFRMIADKAWFYLFLRRPNMNVQPPPSLQMSMQLMDDLAQGKRIFAFSETADASTMERVEASETDIQARNGVVEQARRYYGIRSEQRPSWPW